MRKTVASFSLLFAWLCANGGLLDGVQVFAWAKMFAGYAQTMTVGEALRETFDPAKPCEMCLGVASAKDTARKQLPAAVEHAGEKITLALEAAPEMVLPHVRESWRDAPARLAMSWTESVPVPPPRA